MKEMKKQFEKRLRALLDDLRRPYPTITAKGANVLKALLLGLLAVLGVDLISPMGQRSQRRIRKELRDKHVIDSRSDVKALRKYRLTLEELLDKPAFPIRHGAPRTVRKVGLLTVP